MAMKNDAKFEEELTCYFKIYNREFNKFWPKHLKFSNIFTLMSSFWARYILFELKKYRVVIFHELKSDAKFEEKITYGLKNNMRNLANLYQSTWKFQNWDFDGILLSQVENVWAQNLQRSYVPWQ